MADREQNQSLLPLERLSLLNAAVARALDDNLKAGPDRQVLRTNNINYMGEGLLRNECFAARKHDIFCHRYKEALRSALAMPGPERLAENTRLVRGILQHMIDHAGDVRSEDVYRVEREVLFHLPEAFPSVNELYLAMDAQRDTPRRLPSIPVGDAEAAEAMAQKLADRAEYHPQHVNNALDELDRALKTGEAITLKLCSAERGLALAPLEEPVTLFGVPQNGKYVITYTFDEPVTLQQATSAELNVMDSQAKRKAALQAMEEISRSSVFEFREETDPTQRKATIIFGQARYVPRGPGWYRGAQEAKQDEDWFGYASMTGAVRQVVVRADMSDELFAKGRRGYGTLVHEILHTLGGAHGGDSTFGTIMSRRYDAEVEGLSPYDIAWLHDHYGKPKTKQDAVFSLKDLTETSTLYANGAVTLDLRGAKEPGVLRMDLTTPVFADQMHGKLARRRADGRQIVMDARRAVGQKIRAVLADDETQLALSITPAQGMEVAGGGQDDVLTLRGGNRVTGHGGRDLFRLDAQSSHANRVTDFTPGQDKLAIAPGMGEISLRFEPGDAGGRGGTTVSLHPAKGMMPVASVRLEGIAPPQARDGLVLLPGMTNPAEITLAETAAARPDFLLRLTDVPPGEITPPLLPFMVAPGKRAVKK